MNCTAPSNIHVSSFTILNPLDCLFAVGYSQLSRLIFTCCCDSEIQEGTATTHMSSCNPENTYSTLPCECTRWEAVQSPDSNSKLGTGLLCFCHACAAMNVCDPSQEFLSPTLRVLFLRPSWQLLLQAPAGKPSLAQLQPTQAVLACLRPKAFHNPTESLGCICYLQDQPQQVIRLHR
jgi:hypothetical protein